MARRTMRRNWRKRWNPASLAPLAARLSAQIAAMGYWPAGAGGRRSRCRGGLAAGFDLAPAQADVT